MYTLHHAAEIRTIDQIEELSTVPRTVKPSELKLAKQVVDMFEGELNLKDYKDEYKEELRKIIDARVAGEEYVAEEVEEPPTNVVDLMAALRKSLDAASASKKKPAKAELPEKKAAAKAEPKKKRAAG
jgi:DNA end-binding protein Ku